MQQHSKGNIYALLPLVIFLGVYMTTALIAGDFYKISITVAGMAASIAAVAMSKETLNERIHNYSKGATDSNIMVMIWIFVLAGAFAASAKAMGAVDATVALTLKVIPEQFLPAGIFIAACFTSISIGTSVGTIVALTPIAATIAEQTGCETAWIVAVVVGGAFFGDNLSFISDTTIAATRTQGCTMRDKFRTNFAIVAPAAFITLLVYTFTNNHITSYEVEGIDAHWATILPYIFVLTTALTGVNVLLVLTLGIVSAGIIGLLTGSINLIDWIGTMGEGINSMGELIIITMMAGGILELTRLNGGIEYIISRINNRITTRRGAESAIAAIVMAANICTANNTVAIISIGEIARNIASRFGIAPRRAASILDTFSCFMQGMLPYGAQLLMAAGLAAISPMEIIPHLYYPFIMGACAVTAIILQWPRYRT